jgi:hypothetical protein
MTLKHHLSSESQPTPDELWVPRGGEVLGALLEAELSSPYSAIVTGGSPPMVAARSPSMYSAIVKHGRGHQVCLCAVGH